VLKIAHTPRILIVEDDHAVNRLFERALSEDGYLISTAFTGRDVLRALADGDYILSIIDMGLPDMDGTDLIQAIHSEWPYVRIVAISGWMTQTLQAVAVKAGASAVLHRPIELKELRIAVYSAIDPTNSWLPME
jgi:two-component system KDP operon response regulator KdpE